ncbi:hypothetical protein C7S13_5329 [Burkholderia cepacia]|nr:hypothetical protein [Burkholderia cepacia]
MSLRPYTRNHNAINKKILKSQVSFYNFRANSLACPMNCSNAGQVLSRSLDKAIVLKRDAHRIQDKRIANT